MAKKVNVQANLKGEIVASYKAYCCKACFHAKGKRCGCKCKGAFHGLAAPKVVNKE